MKGKYLVRLARTPEDLNAVLRLRFEVFNLELNGGLESSFLTGRDTDEFDLTCHHLLVVDTARGETVGTYRLRTEEMAHNAGGFYSAGEFDLSFLPPHVVQEAVEIGRACIAREHRNKQVLFLLWRGLTTYMLHNRKQYLFGCCSLPTQDTQEGLRALNLLQRQAYFHPVLCVPPLREFRCVLEGDMVTNGQEVVLPQMFQMYLRFGAKVCSLPAIDRRFKTIDFFVLFDVREITKRTRQLLFGL
jgi:putative hemolysin